MKPELVRHPGMHTLGLAVRTRNALEMEPHTAKIPGLWQRFFAEDAASRIPDRLEPTTLLGIYTDYESDHTGEYTLLVGAEVGREAVAPNGYSSVHVPAGDYRRFDVTGEVPAAVIAAWQDIWDYFAQPGGARRAYTADFEVYRLDRPSEVAIYIAVK